MGVDIAEVTLHVGLGTFRPVKVDNILEHHMHSEFYMVTQEAADKINNAKKNGHRVICVGTTSCRTIESAADENGMLRESSGWTEIFIYPGYQFKVLDCLITNFHLPESTLLMLVSALAGREGLEKFVALIRGYFDQKGMHMQFNVVDRETLLDAQKHPEKYKHLVVRVAGYSALFTTLSRSLQDDIIRRTEQGF